MQKLLILLCLLGLLTTPVLGEELQTEDKIVFFSATDPEGDDNGPGTYVYPRNKAFQPYQGLFDLLTFEVSGEGTKEEIYFETKISTITNPWAAPEGFIHPVIHIYISTGKDGWVKPLDGGPGVIFADRYPWRFALTVIGWESSAFYHPDPHGNLVKTGLSAKVLKDGLTIRVAVPQKLIGLPKRDWRYYVLVGSYDGFGPGFFREVKKESGDWVIGGGLGQDGEPRVMDLLAPPTGKYAQYNQLKFNIQENKPACIYPMGQKTGAGLSWPALVIAGLVVLAAIILLRKPPTIVGFWLKSKEKVQGD